MYQNCDENAGGAKPKFKFPDPPRIQPRLSRTANNSCNSSLSDSSNSGLSCITSNRKKQKNNKRLPPMGIFWDIENCQVPNSRSASAIVQRFREVFLENHRESEFVVVCDVKKENPVIIQELHDSQVNLIHVSSISKNAADEKLRQSLRRFAEVHPAPSSIVLISGDINFAADLSDLRYRKKIRVILVHNVNVAEALLLCANEHHLFASITEDLPPFRLKHPFMQPAYLLISNLPYSIEPKKLKSRLQVLTDNCGGRVAEIMEEEGFAYVRFKSTELAKRAQRRIQGEDVFGNKIKVLAPTIRNYTGRKVKSDALLNSHYQFMPNSSDYSLQASLRDSRILRESHGFHEGLLRPIRGNGSSVSPMDVSYDQWGHRRSRTPQEHLAVGAKPRVHTISGSSEFSEDGKFENFKQQPVELIISNLDASIDAKELRKLLTGMLKEFAMILSLNIVAQSDGNPVANLKVSSQQEAQFIISQLHRQKVGHKRIFISYAQSNSADPDQLRAMVIGILQDVPDKCMPLFKFIELLESRYHCTASVSELNKLRDVCKISDELGSRMIALTQEVKSSPPSNLSRTIVPYCMVHCPNGLESRGWCELNAIQPTNVMISLNAFIPKLMRLLNVHLSSMPLLSFQSCYEQEFHEPLPIDEGGVPLEHLVSCVKNVEISYVGPNKNIKVIKHTVKTPNIDEETVLKSVAPSLAPNVTLLCRELVDLLRTTDRCQLLLSKFIPAYHHHFGRQCRVADYGYTKLLDLFESISHVVQILGDGSRKVITLSHSAQMRRFTSDLLRVLKVQPAKQVSNIEFPSAYEKVMNRSFNPVDYGLCTFEDLLEEVPENTVVVTKCEGFYLVAVPKREQTTEEILKTKQFAAEVLDLLRHAPYFLILFNKFVPAYHHHFGHQCKVSDYGFTKLIELFEAIPDVVKIEELSDGERTVSLTLEQSLKLLGGQILQVIRSTKMNSIQLEDVPMFYQREFGYPLKPQVFDCETVEELAGKLTDFVQVIHSNAGTLLIAIDMDTIPALKIRSWALLLNPPYCKDFASFKYEYQSRYDSNFSMNHLQQLGNVVGLSVSNDTTFISLTALYVLAAQLYRVLYNNGGTVHYNNLERLFFDCFGKPLRLASYNIFSVEDFYNCFNCFFFIKGSKKKSIVSLNRTLSDHMVPLPGVSYGMQRESGQWPPPSPDRAKKISPPKPDTPPTPGNGVWGNDWFDSFNNGLDFSIHLPIVQNPKLLGNPDSLISPAKFLLPRSNWSQLPTIMAPDPTELPMPDKLMGKGCISDDSTDSGVNTKLENSPSDNEEPTELFLGAKPNFATFLNFGN